MIFLSIPKTAILASNNAVPGDKMYPIKTTIEKIASKLTSPSYQAHSELEIQLIQRRIEENQKLLLASGSTKGLELLVAQAEIAKEYVQNSNSSQEIKTQAVNRLVEVLQESQQKLEEQKQNIASTPTSNTVYVYRKETVYIENPTISQGNSKQESNYNSEENLSDSEKITEEIDDTQEEIEEMIDDLVNSSDAPTYPETTQEPTPEPTPEPTEEPTPEPTEEPSSTSITNPNIITNCLQSCNSIGYNKAMCIPDQACSDEKVFNSEGSVFCGDNKICCCK